MDSAFSLPSFEMDFMAKNGALCEPATTITASLDEQPAPQQTAIQNLAPLTPTTSVSSVAPTIPAVAIDVTVQDVIAFRGHLLSVVTTPQGTSFIQAALRRHPSEMLPLAKDELGPHMIRLLKDDHASYSIRRMLEIDAPTLSEFIAANGSNHEFWVDLCNESFHSRRLLVFFLGLIPTDKLGFLYDIVIERFGELACNKNGCLTLQRLISTMPPAHKERAERKGLELLGTIGVNAHGHYLVTFFTEHGNVTSNVQGIVNHLLQASEMRHLVCNKFGSSCVEKAVRAFPNDIAAAVVKSMNSLSDLDLIEVANDAFGNYIVQAVVAVAPAGAVDGFIARLGTLSSSLSYGTKIFRSVAGGVHRRQNQAGKHTQQPAAPAQAPAAPVQQPQMPMPMMMPMMMGAQPGMVPMQMMWVMTPQGPMQMPVMMQGPPMGMPQQPQMPMMMMNQPMPNAQFFYPPQMGHTR